MTWWNDIENEVIRRERQVKVRCEITPREKAVADMEKKILEEKRSNNFCPAILEERIEHRYFSESGELQRRVEVIAVQNVPYIYKQIQARLGSFGVNHMTFMDIRETLGMVSAAYQSAKTQGMNKPLLAIRPFEVGKKTKRIA